MRNNRWARERTRQHASRFHICRNGYMDAEPERGTTGLHLPRDVLVRTEKGGEACEIDQNRVDGRVFHTQ